MDLQPWGEFMLLHYLECTKRTVNSVKRTLFALLIFTIAGHRVELNVQQ